MPFRLRTVFLLVVGILFLWFFYIERAILTPFVLAAIFAYIFNPIVNLFTTRMKIPRTVSVFIIFIVLMGIVITLTIMATKRVINESDDIRYFADSFLHKTQTQVNTLPDWVQIPIHDSLHQLQKSATFSSSTAIGIFPKAFTRALSLLIFLFSSFYFLREGRNFIEKLLLILPKNQRVEAEILLRRISIVLSGYLRGQILMVFFVSLILFVVLSILGVRFSLILAIFSGFAEIVPIIGPITAGAVAVITVLITQSSNFGLQPIQLALIVIAVYFMVRQLQDYLVVPYVMGRVTKLHPLIILFSVLSGEHLMGLLGLIIAVPIAATLKILLEYSLDLVNEQEHNTKGKA